jgi:hypothetical protein
MGREESYTETSTSIPSSDLHVAAFVEKGSCSDSKIREATLELVTGIRRLAERVSEKLWMHIRGLSRPEPGGWCVTRMLQPVPEVRLRQEELVYLRAHEGSGGAYSNASAKNYKSDEEDDGCGEEEDGETTKRKESREDGSSKDGSSKDGSSKDGHGKERWCTSKSSTRTQNLVFQRPHTRDLHAPESFIRDDAAALLRPWALPRLLSSLSLDSILMVLGLLMSEMRVVMVSDNPSKLTSCVLGE